MSTLSNLTATGWTPIPDSFTANPCDVCGADSWFTRMQAPDCNVTAWAGVGGASSDVYGIYCSERCYRSR